MGAAAAAATAAVLPPLPPPVASPPVPPWLDPMLRAPFFTPCPSHGLPSSSSSRAERNMFCTDCPSAAAFCAYCRAAHHADHRTIQVRRSSHHDVVRVSEVQAALDVAGVQTYVINSARVVFLNERPQPRGGLGHYLLPAGYNCELCGRMLLDPFRFCSLGCKLEIIRRGAKGTLVPSGRIAADGAFVTSARNTVIPPPGPRRWRKRGKPVVSVPKHMSTRNADSASGGGVPGTNGPEAPPTLVDGIAHPHFSDPLPFAVSGSMEETEPATYSARHGSRRRKGIPHRAPLST